MCVARSSSSASALRSGSASTLNVTSTRPCTPSLRTTRTLPSTSAVGCSAYTSRTSSHDVDACTRSGRPHGSARSSVSQSGRASSSSPPPPPRNSRTACTRPSKVSTRSNRLTSSSASGDVCSNCTAASLNVPASVDVSSHSMVAVARGASVPTATSSDGVRVAPFSRVPISSKSTSRPFSLSTIVGWFDVIATLVAVPGPTLHICWPSVNGTAGSRTSGVSGSSANTSRCQ
mmetsp:Transcript_54986/g.134849  ORF Transcript_54986/g.134849 Transcript_54986/m.134849 type:complete len:232 (+) Transcript_54986:941-1636(+)